ncbi:MAG: PDZ domain-containing protein, partial [Bdellovibrionaceae bacterium]|nr:PDZ domain-containing protein [Pseudobdellovibrionaceae bacterium]
ACANALLSASQKYGFDVTFEGTLIPLVKTSKSQALTEKDLLAPWQTFVKASGTIPEFPFIKLWAELTNQHIKPQQLSYAVGLGMNGFLSVFKDPHTYLLPAEFYNDVVAKTNHKSLSVGMMMGRNDKNYFVKKVLENSASALGGIKKGDVILKLQGQDVSDLNTYEMGDLLRGEEGSTLTIEILRKGEPIEIDIVRSEKTLPNVSLQMIEGIKPVAVITINKFAVDTCAQLKSTLKSLELEDIRGLLLDLRDNPGGQMEEAACVAGLFIGPHRKVFEVKMLDTTMPSEIVLSQEDKVYDGAMAVLINSGSASAAEIVAGTLQFYDRALLVGERTFGKGSFQEGEIWTKNDKIAIFETKGFYYLPSGQTPQMVGLDPDVKVDFKDRFALREEDQFLNPLKAPGPMMKPILTASVRPELLGCVSFDNDFLPSEDPEMKEAHRVVSCR